MTEKIQSRSSLLSNFSKKKKFILSFDVIARLPQMELFSDFIAHLFQELIKFAKTSSNTCKNLSSLASLYPYLHPGPKSNFHTRYSYAVITSSTFSQFGSRSHAIACTMYDFHNSTDIFGKSCM